MKGCYVLLIVLCFGCSQPASTSNDTTPAEDSKEIEVAVPLVESDSANLENTPVVYITQDGDKYHTADCRYSKTAHEVKLSQAKAEGKTACSICKPNSKTGEKQLRCTVNTADGTRCKRMTTDASGKCFQHRDS